MVAVAERTPTVPTTPQDLATMQARLRAALEPTIIIEECQRNPSVRPGANPRHVFDFQDGMRLIVSCDSLGGEPPVVHVSASMIEGSRLFQQITLIPGGMGSMRLAAFIGTTIARFDELAGCKSGIKLGLLHGHIPHFFGPTRDEFLAMMGVRTFAK